MGRFQSYVSKRPHPPTRPLNDSLSSTFPHHDSRRLTKRQQDVFKLSQHHGAVLHLVVQLQALNEVLEVAGFLGLLDVAVDWVELAGQEWISWMLERTDSQKTWQSLDARCWLESSHSSLFSLQLSKINSLGRVSSVFLLPLLFCHFYIYWTKYPHSNILTVFFDIYKPFRPFILQVVCS